MTQLEPKSKEHATKINRSRCLENLQNYFAEYCANTSIHGVKFLGEKGRSFLERIWWCGFLAVSLYVCVTLIIRAYQKWELSPVVVSFATSETPVFKFPFPAITICPQIKFRKDLANFTYLALKKREGQTLTQEELEKLKSMSLICSTSLRLFEEEDQEDIVRGDDLMNFFMKVQPNFYSSVHQCHWVARNCTEIVRDLFTPIVTEEGICFSFNQLDREEIFSDQVTCLRDEYHKMFDIPHQPPSEWSTENGYAEGADMYAYPRRTFVGGVSAGLGLSLYINTTDLDYLCGDGLQGFKITLHNPLQIPFVKEQYFRVGLNQDATVAVKPQIITTSPQLAHYSPRQRKCLFAKEKALKFFKIYDQRNCIHECLANFTLASCGCVGFFMLRGNSTPVCGLGMQECMEEARATFLVKEVNYWLKPNLSKMVLQRRYPEDFRKNCNCIPSCNSLTFEAEISQSAWNWQEEARILAHNRLDLSGLHQVSRLRIFFKEMQFITSERNELYGQMDFFASCGGLLGLFIGFSFISGVEILYYVSLRLACNIKKYRIGNWSGSEELMKDKTDV